MFIYLIAGLIASTPLLSQDCFDKQAVYNRSTTIFHGSAVEPTIAVNPQNNKRLVASWQEDRLSNGSALEAGIAYSKDGGKHWHKSQIPLQICQGGISQRSGDEWLSYSADGKKVYLCAAVLNATLEPHTPQQSGIVVAISEDDGATWSEPRFLVSSHYYISEQTGLFANVDKCSITADRNDSDRAIAVWASFDPSQSSHGIAQGSITKNGGKSWSKPRLIYDPFFDLIHQGLSNGILNDNSISNNVVVILPNKKGSRHLNGDWLNFGVRAYAKAGATNEQYVNDTFPFQYTLNDIVAVRSTNKGRSWHPNATIAVPGFVNHFLFTGGYTYDANGNITGGIGTRMRNDQTVPSYNVNPCNGNLYIAYQSSAFRPDQLQQIGLVASRDGGKTWSKGNQVNRTPANALNPQAFAPFVAITGNGRVGILYFDFRNDDRSDPARTKMDAWLAIYQEEGESLKFVEEIRLSKRSYIAQNGPATTQGVMTEGDYQFLTALDEDFYAIYIKSFEGPFKPPALIYTDAQHNATLYLDDNRRTAPFFSHVRNCKGGAKLKLTREIR